MSVKYLQNNVNGSSALKLGLLILASSSLTACGSKVQSPKEIFGAFSTEREPQVVSLQRRQPILNQETSITPSSPSAVRNGTAPANIAPPRPEPIGVPDLGVSPQSNAQPSTQPSTLPQASEPSLLGRVGSWFGRQFDEADNVTSIDAPDAFAGSQAQAIEASTITVASLEAPLITPANPVNIPAVSQRKPINNNIRLALRPAEPVIAEREELAIASQADPIDHNDDPHRDLAETLLGQLDDAPASPITPTQSVSKPLAALPPKQFELGDKGVPVPSPLPPKHITSPTPAFGARRDAIQSIVEEVSDEEFETIIAEQQVASDEVLPIGGPLIEIGDEQLDPLAEGEQLLAQVSEPPPLRSIPQAPVRLNEVRDSHPHLQQHLGDEKLDSDAKKVDLHRQIQEEYDDSLRKQYLEQQSQGGQRRITGSTFAQLGLLPLPELQFAGEQPRRVDIPTNIRFVRPAALTSNEVTDQKVGLLSLVPDFIYKPTLKEEREVVYVVSPSGKPSV